MRVRVWMRVDVSVRLCERVRVYKRVSGVCARCVGSWYVFVRVFGWLAPVKHEVPMECGDSMGSCLSVGSRWSL